ncbi:hypothetical protein [Bradyrhizobium jicamae]|uniref:hypothetical protein n=1 Tax=Bradyrhizobium jicamae TaxID=280332 RepID=UPI001BACACFD|nr:hypothetical protein [Bradyrhizobium jicamae]MBR0938767.1 hypothetical protein [Bradyrhizobium jicamae]
MKYDGYRLRAERDGDRVRLITKGGNDWAKRYPWIVEAALSNRQKQFEAWPRHLNASRVYPRAFDVEFGTPQGKLIQIHGIAAAAVTDLRRRRLRTGSFYLLLKFSLH